MSEQGLTRAISAVLDGTPPGELADATRALIERYRPPAAAGTASEAELLAYVATRMPSTAAAMRRALTAVARQMPALEPASQLDLGAGTGAAAWAAQAVWPSLDDVALIERDPRMIRLGEQLATTAAALAGPLRSSRWRWELSSIARPELPTVDLVTAGYVFGELEEAAVAAAAESAWRAASQCLVVVEPGTPAGYERTLAVRDHLVAIGALIIAPCPQQGPCPIESPDWCHFATRVARSPLHRTLKGGRLGYEDEKFSYVAFLRRPDARPAAGRVLRRPVRRKGLVALQVCSADGRIDAVRVGRSKSEYRSASSLEWGDPVPAEVLTAPEHGFRHFT